MAALSLTPAFAVPKTCFVKPRPFISSRSLAFSYLNQSISSLKPLTLTKISASSADSSLSPSPSPASSLKSRLRDGEILYGIFLLSFSPTLAEIAALSGYDFVVIDMEHGPGGIYESLPMLHSLAHTNTPAIIRLPESTAAWAKKALDLGPQGIMFPMVESAKDAKKAVSYCRFPPDGIRGSAHPVVRASNYGINEDYLNNYMEDLLIMCQVETVDGVKKVEDIAAVEGVDCIQMGPLDLSASVGYLWDPGHKKVKEVLRTAEKAVVKSNGGAFLGGFAMPHDPPEELGKRGYNMVSGAIDIGLFRNAAVEDVRKFKMSLNTASNDEEGKDDKDSDDKYWSE
ncbi:hypothetical protein V6N13_030944 [Hibiscus sabdariffa]|uniref:Uncharacterized protein n=2 Tax=Hibiscus sabdariffa TaxID=183260 RepID=A0ABR1ZH29_9ROSI